MYSAFDLSLFLVYVGVRGSTKTLQLTSLGIEASRDAWRIEMLRDYKKDPGYKPKRKTKVFANESCYYEVNYRYNNHHTILKPEPLIIEKLLMWDERFHDCWIFLDEIDQQADRQDWFSNVSKMLSAGAQVMRHRNISFACTIQNLEWLNARLQWQADIIVKCRDLAFTPWGIDNNLLPGEVSSSTWIDKSGIMTGTSFEENDAVYPRLFFGKRFWNAYKTTHDYDVVKAHTKYSFTRPEKQIDMTGEVERTTANQNAIHQAVEYCQYNKPGEKIKSTEFFAVARQFGFDGQTTSWGKYMAQIGVEKKIMRGYDYYNFEKVAVA